MTAEVQTSKIAAIREAELRYEKEDELAAALAAKKKESFERELKGVDRFYYFCSQVVSTTTAPSENDNWGNVWYAQVVRTFMALQTLKIDEDIRQRLRLEIDLTPEGQSSRDLSVALNDCNYEVISEMVNQRCPFEEISKFRPASDFDAALLAFREAGVDLHTAAAFLFDSIFPAASIRLTDIVKKEDELQYNSRGGKGKSALTGIKCWLLMRQDVIKQVKSFRDFESDF
jgi:hypothetical protein